MNTVVVTECEMCTAYGLGSDASWQGLLTGQSAYSPVSRFDVSAFHSHVAGTVPGLDQDLVEGESVASRLLETLFAGRHGIVPVDAPLLLATTTGEVDLLEHSIIRDGTPDPYAGALDQFLEKTCNRLDVRAGGTLVSSACTSATAALARAASMIRSGQHDCVVVVGCDAVTEFVFTGFSSLMALDSSGAHPFDAARRGLTIGEGAAYAILMSGERAQAEGRVALGEIAGWGMSSDANHMTGPSRDGAGVVRAIEQALRLADIDASQIATISAHGTGTVYNDGMEMLAFKALFPTPLPTYSIKGGIGHTMGAAGLIEVIIALKTLKHGCVPPTVGLRVPDDAAAGWVSTEAVDSAGDYTLSTNSGFGGANAALVLHRPGGVA